MRRKILVIDSARPARDVIATILRELNYEVTVACDGREGAQRIDEWHPDLVVTDLERPLVNGLAVLRHVREKQPRIPVLILTAGSEESAAREANLLGATGYVVKPLDLDRLIERVSAALA